MMLPNRRTRVLDEHLFLGGGLGQDALVAPPCFVPTEHLQGSEIPPTSIRPGQARQERKIGGNRDILRLHHGAHCATNRERRDRDRSRSCVGPTRTRDEARDRAPASRSANLTTARSVLEDIAMHHPKKLAILVGGGPAPGINSVIGAATIRGVARRRRGARHPRRLRVAHAGQHRPRHARSPSTR